MDLEDLTRGWLSSLERRHLANLTTSEVARALRALSSCYVERRSKLVEGVALATAGKRAAFALFYGPVHFLITRHVVRSIPEACRDLREVLDLGCGTGGAGAAWAIEARAAHVRGFDRHPWAIDEANATYRHFHIDGRAQQRDIGSPSRSPRDSYRVNPGTGVVAAYVANELTADGRAVLLLDLLSARRRGARILVIEPIARRALPWWDAWRASVLDAGGRADEWRMPAKLPELQRTLARAAGLDPRELTARSLFL